MNSTNLEDIFENEIIPNIKPFELRRKIILLKLNISWLFFLIIVVLLLSLNIDSSVMFFILSILLPLNLLFRKYISIKLNLDSFYLELKKHIINSLIEYLEVKATYNCDRYLGSSVFKKSQITDGRISSTKGHDLISFEKNETKIFFSYIYAYERTKIGRLGLMHSPGSRHHNFTKFTGVLIYIPINNKAFQSVSKNFPAWKQGNRV